MNKIHLLMPLIGLAIFACASRDSSAPGLYGDGLHPCPSSPNCVSTAGPDESHRMAPIPYEGTADEALERLVRVIQAMPRAEIVKQDGNYLHTVFTTRVFRFKDDVEFLVKEEPKVIEFRSASRVGYSDLGKNKSRMEEIRKAFEGKD